MKKNKEIYLVYLFLFSSFILTGCNGSSLAPITTTNEPKRYVSIEELYRNAPTNLNKQENWGQWKNEYEGKYVKGKGRFYSVAVYPQASKLFFIVTISGIDGANENNPTQVALLIEDAHQVYLGEEEGSFLIDDSIWINLGKSYAFEGRVSEFSLFDTELVSSDYSNLIIILVKKMNISRE